MKRALFLIFMNCYIVPCSIMAQVIDTYFANAPQKALPLLDRTSRLDLLDLYNEGLPAKAENMYGGQSELLKKTDDYILLRTSDAGTWQLKMLTAGHDTLLICIQSVIALGTTSTISAYKHDWLLVKRDLPHPNAEKFLRSNSNVSTFERQKLLPTLKQLPIQATWHEHEPVITFNLSLDGLPEESRVTAQKLTQSISYKWQSGKFAVMP